MKVHSDTITRQDILRSAMGMSGICLEIEREFEPRKRNPQTGEPFARGFHVYLTSYRLTGSVSAHNPEMRSATWDEWGIFIDRLFAVDEDATIAHYKGRDDFMRQTREDAERRRKHRGEKIEAPWLDWESVAI